MTPKQTLERRITTGQLCFPAEWQNLISNLDKLLSDVKTPLFDFSFGLSTQGETPEKAEENAKILFSIAWDYYTKEGWIVSGQVEKPVIDEGYSFYTVKFSLSFSFKL